MVVTWGQFRKRYLLHRFSKLALKTYLKFDSNFPGVNEVFHVSLNYCTPSNKSTAHNRLCNTDLFIPSAYVINGFHNILEDMTSLLLIQMPCSVEIIWCIQFRYRWPWVSTNMRNALWSLPQNLATRRNILVCANTTFCYMWRWHFGTFAKRNEMLKHQKTMVDFTYSYPNLRKCKQEKPQDPLNQERF